MWNNRLDMKSYGKPHTLEVYKKGSLDSRPASSIIFTSPF